MGQRADGKYGGPDGVNEVNYGEKTSKYGHYELADWGHAGMNTDGTKWKSQNMEWVEDNRKFEAPAAEQATESQPEGPPPEVTLSNRAAQANAGTSAYEQVLLNQQGTSTIGGSKKPEQAFKNAYQSNLTNELKAKAPGALADKVNDIQQNDVQSALANDDYGLNLAKSGMQPGQAGRRGLEFI
jgi:hypothetical protein